MLNNLELALNEAIQDEYKACATYRLVIQKFGAIRPFINIIEAEKRHIQALIPLFRKYQLPIPVDCWEDKIQAPSSIREACLAGVKAEIENGEMYQKLLNLTRAYPDVQQVFLNLQRASQQNHLRAFQRAAGIIPDFSEIPENLKFRGQQRRRRRGCRFNYRPGCHA
jgi:hypothetical protein